MSKDARFARLQTDPRFRRPKQKALKAEIDERFKDALSADFGKVASRAKVDKRGRAITSTAGSDSMKRFYRLASPDEERVDYARGEGLLESSGSEDESDSEVEEEELELGGKRKVRYLPSDSESEEEEDDEEEEGLVNLSESEDEGQLHVNLSEDDGPEMEEEEEEEEEEGADPTARVAAVNLDWDHLRAADLFTIFNSFLKPQVKKGEAAPPPPGKLLSVRIYPSDFGKERMAAEDAAGPGGGLWKLDKPTKSKRADSDEEGSDDESEEEGSGAEDEEEENDEGEDDDGESEDAQDAELPGDGLDADIDDLEILSDVSNEEGIDMDQLRKYQLERLRYYYAIATFSNVPAAELVHDELNGTEFERTANILDLSYVPEGMEFAEHEVHDECTKESKGYKGNEFVTDALRHSKVKLTWDQDDPNRAKMTRRALTREEIEEEDFANLVAGSGSEDSASEPEEEKSDQAKKNKKEAAKERKEKLRALLAAGDGDVWGKAGAAWQEELADIRDGKKKTGKKGKDDVEITFKPGLTNPAVADEENITSLERYQLRMKEKKRAKKDKHSKVDDNEIMGGDDFFGDDESEDEPVSKGKGGKDAKSKGKKEAQEKKGKRAEDERNDVMFDADAAGLVDDPSRHFALKDLLTAEKEAGKKRKRHRKGTKKELELGPEGFAASVDVADPRFTAIYDEPAFALDPTHAKFTDTSVNREILKRTRDKHAEGREGKKSEGGESGEKGLNELVASVKAKSRPRKRRKH
ncbi:hypothetical protein CspeluHIS016_0500590 [Cutaneotrichosporon spelunceum]|uniref:NUC153 domain-containing protein n=1 Tax=Cutaneotrichosporon spelunceum TaxID=1672016 RepID=A0AAD3YDJ8_9TREE|nr:hypothetical protein CspeluHIS016_0500590 [Cutaneotrichosporon spelunceum]